MARHLLATRKQKLGESLDQFLNELKILAKDCDFVAVNPRSLNGRTPLHLACSQGYFHTVELLLGHNGIDANVVNNDGDTPLHEAVRERNNELVSLLLSKDPLLSYVVVCAIAPF
ncbi:E3 ubiquitin-protein ligase MIB2-like [Octopus vulgaris]|uniref:E3 ubiquitin-protein ligase MIB2-like n=1 Tax=Octopus vulgaris TaxID=6645 RepID=A0AA36HIJ1_OCTVU|nr:E3 ubiquitin-protein ligase MIB2-like [Octopus vulgaris]